MNSLLIKRVYEPAAVEDGFRVLVDRVWPQGVSKGHADLDEWMRDISPTPVLRTWWDHDPARMVEFAQRYEAELDANESEVRHLAAVVSAHPTVTLLYGEHDPVVNHARILRDYLLRRLVDDFDS